MSSTSPAHNVQQPPQPQQPRLSKPVPQKQARQHHSVRLWCSREWRRKQDRRSLAMGRKLDASGAFAPGSGRCPYRRILHHKNLHLLLPTPQDANVETPGWNRGQDKDGPWECSLCEPGVPGSAGRVCNAPSRYQRCRWYPARSRECNAKGRGRRPLATPPVLKVCSPPGHTHYQHRSRRPGQ